MHIAKPRITSHQRQRLVLWLLAMLAWLASVLDGALPDERRARQRQTPLDGLARLVKQLVLLRAMERSRLPRTRKAKPRAGDLPTHLRRRAFGSRLRRILRSPDRRTRVAALMHALRSLDALAARLAKRLACGLTRLWPRRWRAIDVRLACALPVAVIAADSS